MGGETAFKLFIIADDIDEALELHCDPRNRSLKNQQKNFFEPKSK